MNYNLSALRSIAIILVVLGHSIILYDPNWGIYSPKDNCIFFEYLKSFINIIQMPLFFSLSGFLFYFSVKKYSFINILKKKVKRLLIPYFIICFFWMDPIKVFLDVPKYNFSLDFIKEQIMGYNNGHLWFLYTLFAIFIIFKIIYALKIVHGYKEFLIFIILFLCNVFGHKLSIFNNVCTYAIYFYVGYIINEYYAYFNKHIKAIRILVTLLIIIYSFFFVINFINYNLLSRFLAITFIIILYSLNLKSIANNKIMNIIGRNSYGMYLFHSPMIYITFTFWKDINPFLVFVINFCLFGTIALIISLVLKKSNFKFIIGE